MLQHRALLLRESQSRNTKGSQAIDPEPLTADRARFRDYARNAFIFNASQPIDFPVPTYVPLYRRFIPHIGASLRSMPIVSRRALDGGHDGCSVGRFAVSMPRASPLDGT